MDEMEKLEQSLAPGVVAYQPRGEAAEAAVYKYGPHKYACVTFADENAWGDPFPLNMIEHLQRNGSPIPADRQNVLYEILRRKASEIAKGFTR